MAAKITITIDGELSRRVQEQARRWGRENAEAYCLEAIKASVDSDEKDSPEACHASEGKTRTFKIVEIKPSPESLGLPEING